MSATGGASYSYSTYNSGDSWRASESVYDRPHHLPSHRRSPSPRRYMAYDRYVPSRSPHRSGSVWSNNYRPDSPPPISGRYHGDTPNPYLARSPSPWNSSKLTPNPYRRSPSPERHFTSHVPSVNPWDSSTAWLETSKPERQPSSPTPSLSRDRGRRGSILATRMFEPSDSWKHNHSDRRDDTARALSLERSPTIHGDSYRPGPLHKDRSVVGRTGYDSYIPAYPSSSPDSRRKSSPRLRVRNMWPPSRSRSRSVSISPREPRRSSAYRPLRSRTPSHRGRSSSRRRTYSRSRRSTSRSLRSLSRGRRSVSRRRRSRHRYSHSRSSSRARRSSSRTRRSRGRSSSRGRSRSRTRSLRNGNPDAGHSSRLSGKNRRTRSRSRSSIASSIASSRASDRVPIQNVNLPVSMDINGSHDIKQTAQVTANVQSPSRTTSISKPLDGDTKKSESSQPPPASDQSKKVESESVVVTDAPVLQPPLPSPRSPITVQPAEPSDDQSTSTTSHLNGIVEHNSILEAADVSSPTSISPNTASNPSLPVPLVTYAPSIDHRNAGPPVTEHQMPLTSKKVVQPVMPSNDVPALLPTPQPTPDPSPQIRPEIKPPKPEDIPQLSEAKSTAEALRTVVMTRLLYDRQSREERVNPVLATNLQLAAQSRDPRPSTEEITVGRKDRVEQFNSFRGSLVENFRHRKTVMSEKIQRLRKEYISLHERWVAHCASLDDQAKPAVTTESETVQPVTRSTRRSTTMSDAVRSDLEMEQIIASLGYDEATDPNQLSLRNLATVPDMISVTNGQVDYVFDDTNHLVDNPSEYYGPTTGIHDWTDAEKQIFLNKFAAYPKQFGVIAEHIPNKTAAQCVDYYYLHKKKVIDFRKVVSQYAPSKRKRRGAGRKKGNGLLADIRQHDAEVHGESEAPPPPQPSGRTGRKRMTRPTPKESKEPKKPTVSRRTTILQTEDTSTATPTPEPESRPRRRRVQSVVSTANATPTTTPALLTMPAPLETSALAASIPPLASTPASSASLSRTISIAVEDADDDPLDVERPAKRSRRPRKVKSAAIINEELPDLVQEIKPSDQPESTTRRKVTPLPVQWSEEDKNLFLRLLGQYGDDFKRIAASMPNKTTVQVSNYYRTNLVDLDLEKVAAGAPKRSPTPESSKDSPQTTVPDSTPVMSSLTRDTSRAIVKHAPREVPISSTIRSNLSHISKQPELASATTSPYAHLAYPATNGRLGYTPNAIPPVPYPTIPYPYPSYNDSHYAHFSSRTGQRPIAPHPDPDPTRRGSTVPSIHKGETLYPVLQESSVPPTSTPHSLES